MGWFRKDPNQERLKAALKAALESEQRHEKRAHNPALSGKRSADALRAAEHAERQALSRFRVKS